MEGEEQPVGSSGCYLRVVVGRVAAIHGFTGSTVGSDELWVEQSQGPRSSVGPALTHGWLLHVFGHQEAQRWNGFHFSSFIPGASHKPSRLIAHT